MRRFHWAPEHLGPVVGGAARERRWLVVLPMEPFTRLVAEEIWHVKINEGRRRLQALVFVGLLERCGRDSAGMTLYVRRRE